MKPVLPCVDCIKSSPKPLLVEVEDGGIYSTTCENGHHHVHILSNPKFEILFEMALLALRDGYTRETVVTLAATVEEFYRFFVKIVLVRKGLYQEGKSDELNKLWRLISLSERQLGAFATLYLFEKGEVPVFPDSKSTEFRNNVVHKGKIPKRTEVVEYGEKIISFLIPLWKESQEGDEYMRAIGLDLIKNMKDEYKPLKKVSSHYPTVMSRMISNKKHSFEEAIGMAGESSWLRRHN